MTSLLKKILIFTFLFIFSISFSNAWWYWRYYQVYKSSLRSYKNTIINGILNNSLSSRYYKKSGTLSSGNGKTVSRIEGDVYFFVQENGVFGDLAGFTVKEYGGASNNFTATYGGKNFASAICNVFKTNNILSVYTDGGNIYYDITVGGVTKKIKIASYDSNMGIIKKIKITSGYSNCSDPITSIGYRIVYYTHYKKDNSPPSGTLLSINIEGGGEYDINHPIWINKNLVYHISCQDNPSDIIGNAGCEKLQYTGLIETLINKNDTGVYCILQDKTTPQKNFKTGYFKLTALIDKTIPGIVDNKISFIGKEGELTKNKEFIFDTSMNGGILLADKYKLSFSVKDVGIDCNADRTECRGVSGIKEISIYKNGNKLSCSKSYNSQNPNGDLTPDQVISFTCDNIDFTSVGNEKIKLYVKDYAGNVFSKTWDNITIKPNKPNISKWDMSISPSENPVYATNNNSNDNYKISFIIKDRWGNKVTKLVKDVFLTSNSHINLDTYNNPTTNSSNSVSIFNKNLGIGDGSFSIRSLIPGTIKTEFKFKIKKFNTKYGDENSYWYFTKDANLDLEFKQPITAGNMYFQDMSGNNVELKDLMPQTYYKAIIPIYISGYDNNDYSYSIPINENTLKPQPNNLYKILEIKDVKNSSKSYGASFPGNIEFIFKYNLLAGHVVNKSISFDLNPPVNITSKGKTGIFPLGEQKGTGENIQSRILIIGFKTAQGHTYTLSQGKKEFNIETSTIKSKIRKNAFKYINSIEKDSIVNGILIKEGDYKLTDSEYNNIKNKVNTLIVRNGNLTIDANITKRLDIAVVMDNPSYDYNNISSYFSMGNIKITPKVRVINGILYADRSLLVADSSGNPLSEEDAIKSSILKNQLVIFGTLISKNTIGGSIIDTKGRYILPGGKFTTDFKLSSYFDLAFFRVLNKGWNGTPNKLFNDGKSNYIIIKYNPSLRLYPRHLLK